MEPFYNDDENVKFGKFIESDWGEYLSTCLEIFISRREDQKGGISTSRLTYM